MQEEIIPHIRRDPAYLTTHHITLLQSLGDEATEVSPNSIDWSQITESRSLYQFRQAPGPTNPLGRVKFLVPNPYHITLHDTPSRELFARTVRAQSHGCIRLEKPIALAEYLLQEDARWTRSTIRDAIDRGRPRQVTLPSPIPVYLIYHTTWVDQDGEVHFRPDIYRWDGDLSATPDEQAPAACG